MGDWMLLAWGGFNCQSIRTGKKPAEYAVAKRSGSYRLKIEMLMDAGLVARTGVEPVIFALKGRRVNHYSTGPQGTTRGKPSVLEF